MCRRGACRYGQTGSGKVRTPAPVRIPHAFMCPAGLRVAPCWSPCLPPGQPPPCLAPSRANAAARPALIGLVRVYLCYTLARAAAAQTHTMEGPEADRGVAFLTLADLFRIAAARRVEADVNIAVSMLEARAPSPRARGLRASLAATRPPIRTRALLRPHTRHAPLPCAGALAALSWRACWPRRRPRPCWRSAHARPRPGGARGSAHAHGRHSVIAEEG